jgi:hypothetical protein
MLPSLGWRDTAVPQADIRGPTCLGKPWARVCPSSGLPAPVQVGTVPEELVVLELDDEALDDEALALDETPAPDELDEAPDVTVDEPLAVAPPEPPDPSPPRMPKTALQAAKQSRVARAPAGASLLGARKGMTTASLAHPGAGRPPTSGVEGARRSRVARLELAGAAMARGDAAAPGVVAEALAIVVGTLGDALLYVVGARPARARGAEAVPVGAGQTELARAAGGAARLVDAAAGALAADAGEPPEAADAVAALLAGLAAGDAGAAPVGAGALQRR